MHAKEIESDIDSVVGTLSLHSEVNEAACRGNLATLNSPTDKVFSQLQKVGASIVTKANVTWLGDLDVPWRRGRGRCGRDASAVALIYPLCQARFASPKWAGSRGFGLALS